MEKNLQGKVALVTGGSRGIGRSCVIELAARGAMTAFTYLKNSEAADDLERLVSGNGGSAMGIQCDSKSSDAPGAVVEQLVCEHKRLDILVLNAGVTRDQYVMMMSEDEFSQVIDTNLLGAFRFAKAATRPMMLQRSGAIVTVSSVAALYGVAGQANYCASKGGLVSFSRSLAAELAPKGIRVNSVLPGFIDTEMTAKMPRQAKRSSKEKILLKRFGTPEEVAKTVCFLLSEDASYIVGQTLVVDGGLTSTVS